MKKLTYEEVVKRSKKYKSRTEFHNADKPAYSAMIKFEKELKVDIMPTVKTLRIGKLCLEMKKYDSLKEFKKHTTDDFLRMYANLKKEHQVEAVFLKVDYIKEARKYNGRYDLAKNDHALYRRLYRMGKLDEAFGPKTKLTIQDYIEEAKKYTDRESLKKNNKTVYSFLSKNKKLDELFGPKFPIEKDIEIAKKYKNRTTLQYDNQSVYRRLYMANALDDIFGPSQKMQEKKFKGGT